MINPVLDTIRALPIWQGDITNVNFIVQDAVAKYVVRLGTDIPQHHVMRFNELAASRAAHAAGLSPAVVHAQTGITVLDYVDCTTFTPEMVRQPDNLEKILPLIRKCHVDIPNHLRGPVLIFWVFHAIRDYAAENLTRFRSALNDYIQT